VSDGGRAVCQQLNSFDDLSITVLPRLENDKAIGVADVDRPEDTGCQESINLELRDRPILAYEPNEGQAMTGECADLNLLRRLMQPRGFFCSRARCERTHVHNGLRLTHLSLEQGSLLRSPTPPQEQRILPQRIDV
jgi:hypothetical protein